jgi:hypothetical protein
MVIDLVRTSLSMGSMTFSNSSCWYGSSALPMAKAIFLEDKAEDFIFSLTELTFYDIMILAQKSSLF